jgi:hypothetical protein
MTFTVMHSLLQRFLSEPMALFFRIAANIKQFHDKACKLPLLYLPAAAGCCPERPNPVPEVESPPASAQNFFRCNLIR